MKIKDIDKLFLKTAFSCTACDGDVDVSEIKLIKKLHQDKKLFGEINLEVELNNLIEDINKNGFKFLRFFLLEITQIEINNEDQLRIIDTAIKTIEADKEIKHSEIKFFKLLRSKLSIDNKYILDTFPQYEEYLEQDVFSKSYLDKIEGDYFESSNLESLKIENIVIKNFLESEEKLNDLDSK